MPIQFTQEQIDSFIMNREEKLANFVWKDYKKMFPERAAEIANTDTGGTSYMTHGVNI